MGQLIDRYYEYEFIARKLSKAYDMDSTCYDENGVLKNYDYLLMGDDDITVVLKGIHVWFEAKSLYGPCGPSGEERKIVFYGGKGLLALAFRCVKVGLFLQGKWKLMRELHPENESQRLARVAGELGIKPSEMVVLGEGTNTSEVLRSIAQTVGEKQCLLAVTQRLAMIMKSSIDFQCQKNATAFGTHPLKMDYFVIKQDVRDTVRWYNMQRAGGGRVAFHFWGHLLPRFDKYDGKFLQKPFEPSESLRESSRILEKNFLIKQRCGGLRKYCQYLPILWDVLQNGEAFIKDEKKAIEEAKEALK